MARWENLIVGPSFLWVVFVRPSNPRARKRQSDRPVCGPINPDVVTMETNTPIGSTPYQEYLPSPHGSGGGVRSLEPHQNSLSTANGSSVRSKKELADSVTKIKPRDTKSHSLWLDELEEAFRDGDLFDAYMLDARPSLTLIAQRYNLTVVRTEQEIRAIQASVRLVSIGSRTV